MADMRLMEKLRGQKFTDFSYTWDTTYTTILVRSGDGDFPANIRTTATQAFTESSASPTYDQTTFNFILPRRYEYTTVFDGVARGNVKVNSYINNTGVSCTSSSYFVYATLTLKGITSGGVARTLATVTTNTITHTLGGEQTGNLLVDIPFWMDINNQVLNNDERLLLVVTVYGGAYTHSGHVSGSHSAAGTLYHTINTDELFIELPMVP